jgi:hypothetical protein
VSVQTLIVLILLLEFVQSRPVRTRGLELQLKAKRSKQLAEFSEAQLAGTSVFEGIERSPTDSGLARERGLAKLELLALLGYLGAYGE